MTFGIIAAGIIFAWAVYGLHVLDLHQAVNESLGNWFKQAGNPVRFATWLVAVLATTVVWSASKDGVLGELRTEVTGIAITVILIDELVIYRSRLERKQEIFEQLQSPVRDVAVEALRLVVKNEWLEEVIKKSLLVNGQFEGLTLSKLI